MGTQKKSVSQQARERRISQVGDFKKRLGGIIELPSGLVVKVRNPGGLRVFINSGIIPNSLMQLVQKGLDGGQPLKSSDIVKGNKFDTRMIADMNKLMDDVAVRVIVEPKIYPTLTEADVEAWNKENPDQPVEGVEDLRSDERLYADELPDDDKMFLFQWVSGGTRDLESFRQQHQERVVALEAGSGDGDGPQ